MNSRLNVFLLLLTLVVVAGLGINVLLTQAQTMAPQGALITVNTTEDTLNGPDCSLRAAIKSANTDTAVGGCPAGSGRDTIVLGAAIYSLSIANISDEVDEDSANTGDLDITDDLDILGKGSASTVISANSIDRVLHVDPNENNISVVISAVTIQDGAAYEDDIKGGGGVLTSGNLLLKNVIVIQNEAQRGGGVRVTHSGELEILNSVIEGNAAAGGKTTASNEGGGIYGDGPITLQAVQLLDNQAQRGGGIFCDESCTLLDVSISKNYASSRGAGVYNDHASELNRVTIDKNQADEEGGGVYSEAEISLINVTVSNNRSTYDGSAMLMEAEAHLINVTIYQNQSNPGEWSGLVSNLNGGLDLVNTIIAGNTPHNCYGDFSSYGYNIASDGSCDLTHDTDLHNTNPRLDSLRDNGGETKTHALLANSPAIDAGSNEYCASTDQRHISRPTDGNRDGEARCDVGAYETVPGGILRIQPIEYPVDEDVGTVKITVTRSDGSDGAVSVYFMTLEGTAQNKANRDADYSHTFGQLTWADGDSSAKTINVKIIDDQSYELDEIFNVYLADPDGGVGIVEVDRRAWITILENDEGFPPATPVPDPGLMYMPMLRDD